MSDLVVIVPSRGRPGAVSELRQAFADTCTVHAQLIFAVDDGDPTLDAYADAVMLPGDYPASLGVVDDPTNMVHALNRAATMVANTFTPMPFAVGFMGDDHRPRTKGWDQTYLEVLGETLGGTGIVYGDDLLQGQALPTQCAMTSNIIRALGYMAPPNLAHLYVDNFWRDLGSQAGCLAYLPDVVIEHVHPIAKKAEWDEGYERVNAPEVYEADAEAYKFYVDVRLATDVDLVKELRSGP